MIPYLRKKKILEFLKKEDIIYISDISSLFKNLSDSTIRRDLKILEKEGVVSLLHGGAAKLIQKNSELPIETKRFISMSEKERIARFAAQKVQDGEFIYIDSGTTTELMLQFLMNKDITIVTSSLAILNSTKTPSCKCILLPGEINFSLGSVSGSLTDSLLLKMYFDKSFLGASGCSKQNGISTADSREGNKKKIILSRSKESYTLVDSSKIGKVFPYKALDLQESRIITDQWTTLHDEFPNTFIVATK